MSGKVVMISCVATLLWLPQQLSAQDASVLVGRTGTPVRMRTGAKAISEFKPQIDAQLEGGECRVFDDHPMAARAVIMYYPAFRTQHTSISLWFDANGALTRYVENRGGVPKPGLDPVAMSEEAAKLPKTSIQLEIPENRAFAMNSGGDNPPQGVRGTIDEFDASNNFAWLRTRIAEVTKACMSR